MLCLGTPSWNSDLTFHENLLYLVVTSFSFPILQAKGSVDYLKAPLFFKTKTKNKQANTFPVPYNSLNKTLDPL